MKLLTDTPAHVHSAQVLEVSTHWLRHTTLSWVTFTWVERNFGDVIELNEEFAAQVLACLREYRHAT